MRGSREKRLIWSIVVTLIVFAGEAVGGFPSSNSLSLLSDAGHVFTDVFALALSLIAALIVVKTAVRLPGNVRLRAHRTPCGADKRRKPHHHIGLHLR